MINEIAVIEVKMKTRTSIIKKMTEELSFEEEKALGEFPHSPQEKPLEI